MNRPAPLRPADDVDDALAEYRVTIAKLLSAMGAVALGLLALVHLHAGRLPLVALNAGVAAVLAGSAWALHHRRAAWVPFPLLVLGLIAAITASIHLQGVPGLLWAYPAMFLAHFILPLRQARPLSVLLLACTTVTSYGTLGGAIALRVLVSLCFVLLMIHVVLRVLGDLQRALVTQAITDPLTGSYNRRHLQAQLDRLATPAGPAAQPGPALLAIDIDNFKAINDRHGHDTGDRVLQGLVRLISERQRLGDVLFRTGGEEFMLLLPRTRPDDALRLAEDLCARVAASPLLPGDTVTVSIGVSGLGPQGRIGDWLKAADRALYRAKQNGRNRVERDEG